MVAGGNRRRGGPAWIAALGLVVALPLAATAR
jgi:hypothetical protein